MQLPFSLTDDLVFKALFADNEDTELLIGFLQAVLPIAKEDYDEIVILNPYQEIKFIDDKNSILDIKLYTKSKKLINIEIQNYKSKDLKDRILYYGCNLIAEQVKKGEKRYNLTETFVILS